MIKRNRARRILWYESIGFVCLIGLSWLDELLSLPHLLFGSGPHSNWHEAAMESLFLLAVWGIVFWLSRRLLARLYYLEGFLRVCAWCRKIGHEDEWRTVEDYFKRGFDIKTSHGMCPDCQEKWKAETNLRAA
jgi:hypothetical protein